MATAFHGKAGKVLLKSGAGGGNPEIDALITKWTINREIQLVPAQTLDISSGIKTSRYYVGFHKDSGSFEGWLTDGAGPVLTEFDGSSALATFTSGDGTAYTANIRINNLSIENDVDDLGKFSATFDIEGVVSIPA